MFLIGITHRRIIYIIQHQVGITDKREIPSVAGSRIRYRLESITVPATQPAHQITRIDISLIRYGTGIGTSRPRTPQHITIRKYIIQSPRICLERTVG